MKNYTIFLYIFLLIFISKINAGPGTFTVCMGLCLAPRHLACAAVIPIAPVYGKCMVAATVQCTGSCYLAMPVPVP